MIEPLSFLLTAFAGFVGAVFAIKRSLPKTAAIFYLIMLAASLGAPLTFIGIALFAHPVANDPFGWRICAGITVLVFGVIWRSFLVEELRQESYSKHLSPRRLTIWAKENWIFLFFAIVIFSAVCFTWRLAASYETAVGKVFPASEQKKNAPVTKEEQEESSEKKNRAKWGTTGDYFGGMLNPAFSLIGLLLLLATLYQNQKELRLSRTELEISSNALNAQATTAEKQRFEDTFFSLLGQLDRCLERVESVHREPRAYPQSIAKDLKEELVGGTTMRLYDDSSIRLAGAKSILLKKDPAINQLFRVLYQILKLIAERAPGSTLGKEFNIQSLERSVSSPAEKFYSNLVRALLSDDIYYLLAVNASSENNPSFRAYTLLVERYSMLEHMSFRVSPEAANVSLLLDILQHYRRIAFGSNDSIQSFIMSYANTADTV